MNTEAIKTVAEFVAGIGIDVAKEKVKEKLDEKKLRSSLTIFIENQSKYNEICSLSEEIDFQGLVEYIQENLIEQVGVRIFNVNRKKRGEARQEIIDAAIIYSKANTEEAKRRVSKLISICLEIIYEFYKEHHLSLKDYFLADMIADVVNEKINDTAENILSTVNTAKDTIIAGICENSSLFSLDKAMTLAENGKVNVIGAGIKKVLDHISVEHPCYPDFGYDYVNGIVRSIPLTPDAKRLYPPRIELTGPIKIGDRYFNDPNGNPLNYAYRHQLTIKLDVLKAKKLLGEKMDPIQDEVDGLVGRTVIVSPPEFPPAFPCSIMVGTQTLFNYIFLRTQEILDDGVYIVGNREQGSPLYFEVRINPDNPSNVCFKINVAYPDNNELLRYVKFIKALTQEKYLRVHVISLDEDLVAGYINNSNYKTGFSSIDEEIDFLERVCDIESYFGVSLDPKGVISSSDYCTVLYVSDLVRNDQITRRWSETTLSGNLDQHFREDLMNIGEKMIMLSFVMDAQVDLFGAKFNFPIRRTYKCAQMADYEKVKRKVEVLDDGDRINITFRATEDNRMIETLKITENVESAS